MSVARAGITSMGSAWMGCLQLKLRLLALQKAYTNTSTSRLKETKASFRPTRRAAAARLTSRDRTASSPSFPPSPEASPRRWRQLEAAAWRRDHTPEKSPAGAASPAAAMDGGGEGGGWLAMSLFWVGKMEKNGFS